MVCRGVIAEGKVTARAGGFDCYVQDNGIRMKRGRTGRGSCSRACKWCRRESPLARSSHARGALLPSLPALSLRGRFWLSPDGAFLEEPVAVCGRRASARGGARAAGHAYVVEEGEGGASVGRGPGHHHHQQRRGRGGLSSSSSFFYFSCFLFFCSPGEPRVCCVCLPAACLHS